MDNREHIYDPLRKKEVALTPEEEVRQYFISWLIKERNYKAALMASEYSIKYNRRSFRCDIVCFNRQLQPFMIVECKAPSVKIDNAIIEQICRYNMVLKVKYLVITNGVITFAFEFSSESGSYKFISDIPEYGECAISK